MEKKIESIDVGRAAIKMAISENREEEQRIKAILQQQGYAVTAVDFGGEFIPSIVKIVERAVVAAERQQLVTDTHVGAGAVAGAAGLSWEVPVGMWERGMGATPCGCAPVAGSWRNSA